MARDDVAPDAGNLDRAKLRRGMQPRTEGVQMQKEMMERGADRRRGVSSYFTSPVNDRRRPGYERRNRTTVRPVPLVMAVRGDKRRFEDSGME